MPVFWYAGAYDGFSNLDSDGSTFMGSGVSPRGAWSRVYLCLVLFSEVCIFSSTYLGYLFGSLQTTMRMCTSSGLIPLLEPMPAPLACPSALPRTSLILD